MIRAPARVRHTVGDCALSTCHGGTSCTSRLRVAACDPGTTVSYLVSRITGTDLCFGSPMPRGSTLTTAQIQVLTDWVAEGAPNN